MMEEPKHVTWNEFQARVVANKEDSSQYEHILYRGHSCSEWPLVSTLKRFQGDDAKDMSANRYYEIVKEIVLNDKIEGMDYDGGLPEAPFKIGLMYANEEHKAAFVRSFAAMIALRHLRFPSPILDCTTDADIAALFALQDTIKGNAAIYCIKKLKPALVSKIDLFAPQLHLLPHTEIVNTHERHAKQKAAYTLFLYNNRGDYYRSVNNPYFHLASIENCDSSNYVIEKYIITDSKVMQEKIQAELRERGVTTDAVYGRVSTYETGILKEIAIKKLLNDK